MMLNFLNEYGSFSLFNQLHLSVVPKFDYCYVASEVFGTTEN